MSANDVQVGGRHYKSFAIQPWDFFIANNVPYLEACIIKYTLRWKNKGGVEDLEKARHYLDKLIEVAKAEKPSVLEIPKGLRIPPLPESLSLTGDGHLPATPRRRPQLVVDTSALGPSTVDWSDLK